MRYLTGWLWQFLWFRTVVVGGVVSDMVPMRVKLFLINETPYLVAMKEYELRQGNYAAAAIYEGALREGVTL